MTDDAADLARRQAELAAHLTGAGPLPAGFDPRLAATAARALDAKRAGAIADAFPSLASALGPDFRPEVRAWLPGRERASPSEQATAFGLALAGRRPLPEHVLRHLAVRLAGPRPRRPWVRVRVGGRTAVVLSTPRRIRRVWLLGGAG